MAGMRAYILCKNEEANLERCLVALAQTPFTPVVVDSGSTDRTLEIAAAHGAEVEPYRYVNHCKAYNDLTTRHTPDEWCLVLDADMIVSRALAGEIAAAMATADVVQAPVRMVYGGQPLRHASLYPPKPIAFRGGAAYFVPMGHGEKLKPEITPAQTRALLLHDDRKSFRHFLDNQLRYADAFIARAQAGQLTYKDRIRLKSPFGIFALPFIILFVKGGILDGKGGLLYALDRLIVEAIKYRRSLWEDLMGAEGGTEASQPAQTTS